MGGPIADAILDTAVATDVDLIAMSTHGRGGLARLVLGSVADEVVRRTHVPVLLIRPMAE
jgi:nucleotide-binding universal stress UspA family protein